MFIHELYRYVYLWVLYGLNLATTSLRLVLILLRICYLCTHTTFLYIFMQIQALARVDLRRVPISWLRRLKVVLLDQPQTLGVTFFPPSYCLFMFRILYFCIMTQLYLHLRNSWLVLLRFGGYYGIFTLDDIVRFIILYLYHYSTLSYIWLVLVDYDC